MFSSVKSQLFSWVVFAEAGEVSTMLLVSCIVNFGHICIVTDMFTVTVEEWTYIVGYKLSLSYVAIEFFRV